MSMGVSRVDEKNKYEGNWRYVSFGMSDIWFDLLNEYLSLMGLW